MCGISGFVHLDGERSVDGALLERMTRTLSHRGPDDEGYYTSGPAALGMRRLRIIDLAGGRQPIANEDRTVWVVFNGEIYNFADLRRQLAARHSFATQSDTEVIVHLYEEQGPDCVNALRGMFAFALWDTRRQRLLLARDHVGEKPLYYAVAQGTLWFGSEIKALLAVPTLDRELDLSALDDYLALGYVPGPKSMFRTVRKIEAGSLLQLERGQMTQRRYWRPQWTAGAPVDEKTALEGVRSRLEEAVSLQQVADVPVGAFLSGGVDSSTVVWLMTRQSTAQVKTFSIGFDEVEYNELRYAREVARALGTEHYEEVAKPDALQLLPELVGHFDEPFGDSSAIPTYLVARLARQHVTVALSGDGGDEVFAGYERYRKAEILGRVRTLLLGGAGTRAAARAVRFLASGQPPAHRLAAALDRAALPAVSGYLAMVGLYTPELRSALLRNTPESPRPLTPENFAAAWQQAIHLDPIRRMQAVDFATYLPDDILVKVDRASMAVSLEMRAPLLYPPLVEYVASLPTRLKFHGGVSKWILRRLLAGHVPPSVLTRPKRGFAVPLGSWLRNDWQEDARALLFDGAMSQYFDPRAVATLLQEHASGAVDHAERLWLLLVFSAWHQRFVRAS